MFRPGGVIRVLPKQLVNSEYQRAAVSIIGRDRIDKSLLKDIRPPGTHGSRHGVTQFGDAMG
jgi:hypothetical protein